MYVVGLAVFTLASAAAALAQGPGRLIGARVLQGAGAAVLLPLTLTLISEAFPAEKRVSPSGCGAARPDSAWPPGRCWAALAAMGLTGLAWAPVRGPEAGWG